MATEKISVDRARALAELTGQQYQHGYCECRINGTPHTVDFRLVPGHSDRDHLADRKIAAAINALAGRDFATTAAARTAAYGPMAAAVPGGPRIALEIAKGTLAARWQTENRAALQSQAHEDGWVAELAYRIDRDTEDRSFIKITYWVVRDKNGDRLWAPTKADIDDDYRNAAVAGYRTAWTTDDLDEPDATWEIGEFRPCV